jgi:hypothetical protein
MPDEVEMAASILDEHIARGLSRIDPTIPVGVAGECDGCGEQMPRLVNGLCGFCRDGRRPPAERYDRVAPPSLRLPITPVRNPVPAALVDALQARAADPVHQEEEDDMGKPADAKSVTITARGAVLDAIEAYVREHDASYGAAGFALIERALAPQPSPSERTLSDYELCDLLDEIAGRVVSNEAVAALTARAEAAEATLAQVRAAVTGSAGQD